MRVLYQTLCLCCCLLSPVLGKTGSSILTSQPAYPTRNARQTLLFNLAQSGNSGVKDLLDKTEDAYWSFSGDSTESGDKFKFLTVPLANFTGPFSTDKLITRVISDTFYLNMLPEPAILALPANVVDGINYVGTTPTDPGKAILVLYAPKKNYVHLLGEFNNWTMNPAYLMNRTPDGNRYWIELPLKLGETTFQYLVDGTIAVADPYSEKILDR
ncbi:MAG: alpha-amylase, partial [Spirosoma sp.]|nr:alpha-amylase [Spirosoma sp.]